MRASSPCGGGNFSFNDGISFDDVPMNAAASPAPPLVQLPICKVANHAVQRSAIEAEFIHQEAKGDHQDAVHVEFDVRHHEAAIPRQGRWGNKPDRAADGDLQHPQEQRPTFELFL